MALTELPKAVANAKGLAPEDRKTVQSLVKVWQQKLKRNEIRHAYYTMHAKPKELGIAVPPQLRDLEQVVGWSAKAVDMLANRSQFEGFVTAEEAVANALSSVVADNRLKRAYRKGCKSQLELCCSFITVTDDGNKKPVIRLYPAMAASAIWDYAANAIKAGLVIVDYSKVNNTQSPSWVDVFTQDAVITIKATDTQGWIAEYKPHSMGRCLMEAMPFEASLARPFGKSRISRSVMNITDDAMRASVRSEIAGEFFTSPQKYLLGVKSDPFEKTTKWDAYIGNIFTISKDDNGDTPEFGQLSQGSMQPHIDYIRSLAARFSGETNVPLNTLGVINDNPSSAEAIYAAKEELIIDAQNLNADNGEALKDVAYMALAIVNGTDYSTERARGYGLQPRFKNPAMPSLVSQADAAIKIATAAPWFAESNVFLEELGFSEDVVQRLETQRRQYQADQILNSVALEVTNGQSSGTD